jgi:hypothetical protein
MWMKRLAPCLAILLSGCARSPGMRSALPENDSSIVFPQFFEHTAVEVGVETTPYELDGVTLQAILVAIHDFLPPTNKDLPCWERPEAYRYRVIRQGNIIFVHMREDLEYCGLQYIAVDSGAEYAVSTDGRILRRRVGAEPEPLRRAGSPFANDAGIVDVPGSASPGTDAPLSPPHAEGQDGGSGLVPLGPPPLPKAQDGGSPGRP